MLITRDPAADCSQPEARLGSQILVTNDGDASAGPFTVRILETSHRLIGLTAGESRLVWLDEFRAAGEGESQAVVDTDGEVAELSEDNNRWSGVIGVPTPAPTCEATPTLTPAPGPLDLPDLSISAGQTWTCPCWPCPGHVPFADLFVRNRGVFAAGHFDTVVSYERIREVMATDGLAPEQTAWWKISLSKFDAMVDAGDQVEEADEDNNWLRWIPIPYTPPPPCPSATPVTTPGPAPVHLPDLIR